MILSSKGFQQCFRSVIWLLPVLFIACDPEPAPTSGNSTEFASIPEKYPVTPGLIDEASGLTDSKNLPEYLWTHQDSGRPASLYLLSKDAKSIREYVVSGAHNRDWEDMASGPGPEPGVNYLYIGDIGNNNSPVAEVSVVYRIPEINNPDASFSKDRLEKIQFRYPDGPRDAETLMLDPLTKDIFIISKETLETGIYRLPYPQSTSEIILAEKIGIIPSVSIATSGDVSVDGSEILIRTYISAYYWKRNDGESVGQTLTRNATKILTIELEPQGEAICFDRDLSGFFTLSEIGMAKEVSLNFYKRK